MIGLKVQKIGQAALNIGVFTEVHNFSIFLAV